MNWRYLEFMHPFFYGLIYLGIHFFYLGIVYLAFDHLIRHGKFRWPWSLFASAMTGWFFLFLDRARVIEIVDEHGLRMTLHLVFLWIVFSTVAILKKRRQMLLNLLLVMNYLFFATFTANFLFSVFIWSNLTDMISFSMANWNPGGLRWFLRPPGWLLLFFSVITFVGGAFARPRSSKTAAF